MDRSATHHEVVRLRGPWTVVLLALSIGVTVVLVAIGIATREARDTIVAAAAAIVSGFLLVNFWALRLDLDAERLELRFGLFARHITRADIRDARAVPASTRRYTGWGVRRLPDGTVAWLVPGAPAALRLQLRDGVLVFSTADPNAVLDALAPAA